MLVRNKNVQVSLKNWEMLAVVQRHLSDDSDVRSVGEHHPNVQRRDALRRVQSRRRSRQLCALLLLRHYQRYVFDKIDIIVRECVFYVFFKIQKNVTFYVFLKCDVKKT